MGLENLKSVFTKGLEKFRNTELKTFPRPILGQNYPSTPEKESVIGHQVDYPSPLEEKHMENKFKSSGESNNDVGLFNSVDNKYSYSYATINKPQGYLNSPFGNDIFSLGNINSNGSGYSEKYKSLMSLYKEIRGSTPSIYFANATDINEGRTIVQNQIPTFNNLVPLRGGSTSNPGINFKQPYGISSVLDGVPLGSNKLGKTGGWEALYNSNHTYKSNAYPYSQFVNPNRLNIRFGSIRGGGGGLLGSSFGAKGRGTEPYIVTKIGSRTSSNWLSPSSRAKKDYDRVRKYLFSRDGLTQLVKLNAQGSLGVRMGFHKHNALNFGYLSQLLATRARMGRSYGFPLGVRRDWPFGDTGFGGKFGSKYDSDNKKNSMTIQIHRNILKHCFPELNDYSERSTRNTGFRGIKFTADRSLSKDARESFPRYMVEGKYIPVGDPHTIAPLSYVNTEAAHPMNYNQYGSAVDGDDDRATHPFNSQADYESGKTGMPFYFRDLRDGAWVMFRAYITGITENVNPEWSPHDYVGRSEPVYTYEKTSRDIAFNLRLSVNTRDELFPIYQKLNRLTSMCYPEYHYDSVAPFDGSQGPSKQRMKPPLLKFRLGELYGSGYGQEMLGFLKSVTYTIPESATWETGLPGGSWRDPGMTKGRKDESKANHLRVPKLIDAAIAFQVIHKQTPDLRMAKWEGDEGFYGIVNKGVGVGKETNYGGGDYLFEGEFPIKDNSEEKIF